MNINCFKLFYRLFQQLKNKFELTIMIISKQNSSQNSGSSLTQTSKFFDKNNYTNKVLQDKINLCDKKYKSRVISSNQPNKQMNKLEIEIDKYRSAGQQNNPITDFMVPTFGNWKKQDKVTNASLEANPYRAEITNKNRMIRLLNGENSDRSYSIKQKHPKIPKNCKFLAKFCANENSDQYMNKVLPHISRTEKLINSERISISHRAQKKAIDLQSNKKELMKHNFLSQEIGQTISTRQSCQLKEKQIIQLKKQFIKLYLKQKQKYESVLTSNRIKVQIKDDEFQSFLERMKNKF